MSDLRDYRIASETEGYEILLRNKRLVRDGESGGENTVLFVHGATYGSTYTFDYPIEGRSWMDVMAEQGFDAWCIDLLGYGDSDRPREMDLPPQQNEPLIDTAYAVREVGRAVNFILQERGIRTVKLIGYSWGTAICGAYASRYADNVSALVLSGALWVAKDDSAAAIGVASGAYRTVDAPSAIKRWRIGLSQVEIDKIVPAERVKQWCEDVVQCDPANGFESPRLRAPAGVMKDFQHCSVSGEPWYDPSEITAPTQIVVGEFDRETTPAQAQAVFARLSQAAEKRLTIIGSGTHMLLLENNRAALFGVVADFLR
jgi:pimeloyl-ACP methyl ester carboxylesterase